LVVFLPLVSRAQDSVSFTSNPLVDFTVEANNNAFLGYSGSLVLSDVNNVGISNIQVKVSISPDPVTNPSPSSGQVIGTYYGSSDIFSTDIICAASDCGFSTSQYGGSFIPGHTYYLIFSVLPINATTGSFTGQTLVVQATVPGGNPNNGGGSSTTTPPCDNPAADGSCPQTPDFDPNYVVTPLSNPLGTNFDIINFLDQLFTNFVKIAFPFLVLFMVYSGFLFVEARGNEQKLAAAKQNLFYVVVGALIVFSSWTIAHAIKGTVNQLSYATKVLTDIINLV
jgi:hypothetical protein